ncbi:MAG: lectin like domain-containing protein [Lachnospira sp.]
MKVKKFLVLLISSVVAVTTFGYTSWAADRDGNAMADDSVIHVAGYVASELDGNTPAYYPAYAMMSARARSVVPSSYPESMDVFTTKYPQSRNQNPYGTCWSFASLGLAEFDLINDGNADKNIDLSELGLAYFTYNYVTDPLGGTAEDTAKYYNENSDTTYLNRGGNYQYSSRRLMQWIGSTETDVPYSNASDSITTGLADKYAYNYNDAHLHNVYQINIDENTEGVKQAIMEHGAVGIMYMHHDNIVENMAWNSEIQRYTYYDDDNNGFGHAVMIVGWDDAFSKDNFNGTLKPENDGAWLIRNSWGTYCDYFWMSYDTVSLINTAWVFDFVADDGYDNNYQLDGGIDTYQASQTTVANVFSVQPKAGVDYESLKAVSISMTRATDVSYTIDIYTELTDARNPLSGTKQETATTVGCTGYAGVYTIELSSEVRLNPDTTFAVVVTVDKSAIDCEEAVSIVSGDLPVWERKVSQFDYKSLYDISGSFIGVSPRNYCIKAYTANNVGKTDAEKVSEAKTVVESAIMDITGTNELTKAQIQNLVDNALSAAGITEVKAVVGELDKTEATTTAPGSVKADIELTCGSASDTVKLDKTIAQLPNPEPAPDPIEKNGLNKAEDGNYYYYVDDVVDTSFTGFADYDKDRMYVKNGKVDDTYTDVIQDGEDWVYVESGKVRYDYTGIRPNANGWWRIENGKVNFNFTGLADNENGRFYIENGMVDFSRTDVMQDGSDWVYVEGGHVKYNYTGIRQNANGWWRIENGKVNFNFTGIASNENGMFYIKDGLVRFDYTGTYVQDEIVYNIVGGVVVNM